MIDLTVVSVLLDAGAGPDWSYVEEDTGLRFGRSEGLGVASWHAFRAGMFSGDPMRPWQADAAGLRAVSGERLAKAFQCSPANPLVGLSGRVEVLHRLADALPPHGRPADLFDVTGGGRIKAHDILSRILASLSAIWLAPNIIRSEAL